MCLAWKAVGDCQSRVMSAVVRGGRFEGENCNILHTNHDGQNFADQEA